jgi:cytochrome c biogenesis protein CcmG, thiol:disulfide interchange protein DsbE
MTETSSDQALPSPTEEGQPAKPQPRHLSAVAVTVAFILLFVLLSLLAWSLVKSRRGPVESGLAPDFTLTSYDGRTVTLSKLRGQVVIINFWASWCQPCRLEAAYLEQTWRKYKDQGVVFIGVDYVDTEPAALAYIKEFDITYINGPDLGTRISQAYNIKGMPETYYVTKNGELRGVKIGPLLAPELDEKNQRAAQGALAERSIQ